MHFHVYGIMLYDLMQVTAAHIASLLRRLRIHNDLELHVRSSVCRFSLHFLLKSKILVSCPQPPGPQFCPQPRMRSIERFVICTILIVFNNTGNNCSHQFVYSFASQTTQWPSRRRGSATAPCHASLRYQRLPYSLLSILLISYTPYQPIPNCLLAHG